jgi:acyl-CoA reductase-like NAD-dependent aldehyde dehydrogenase
MRCADEEEALRLANDSRYGLGASIWSKDLARARRLARRIDAGSITINESSINYGALELPFGGRRESGVGVVNGPGALANFSHAQPVLHDRFGLKAEWVWYPFDVAKLEGLKKAVYWMFATPLRWLMR